MTSFASSGQEALGAALFQPYGEVKQKILERCSIGDLAEASVSALAAKSVNAGLDTLGLLQDVVEVKVPESLPASQIPEATSAFGSSALREDVHSAPAVNRELAMGAKVIEVSFGPAPGAELPIAA